MALKIKYQHPELSLLSNTPGFLFLSLFISFYTSF